eukprot:2290701-Pleurochrysis_carterae.AAC.2
MNAVEMAAKAERVTSEKLASEEAAAAEMFAADKAATANAAAESRARALARKNTLARAKTRARKQTDQMNSSTYLGTCSRFRMVELRKGPKQSPDNSRRHQQGRCNANIAKISSHSSQGDAAL